MIVGTEGTTVDQPEESVDTTAGKGAPRADAGKEQAQGKQSPSGAAEPAEPAEPAGGNGNGNGGGTGGSGGSGGGGGGNASSDPTADIQKNIALAEAMKPLEGPTADLYSPDKQPARDALQKAYAKTTAQDGDLRTKLDAAHKKFDRAASDMAPRLDEWIKLLSSGPLADTLRRREDTKTQLDARSGDREKARANAQADAKNWADRHADWSAPADKMTALIGTYVDKIDKLNADINNDVNRDAAILSFWFEVAPAHLQIDDKYDTLSGDAKSAVDKVKGALGDYKDLAAALVPGKDRKDGSLWLIAPADLDSKRKWVLDQWIKAAGAQADAEAKYKQNPDDAASLKQQWDKLKDDTWIKDAKAALTPAP
jgi:hypothetical protein